MATLKEKLVHILFPNRCAVCDRIIAPGAFVCGDCQKRLLSYSRIKGARCEVCGFAARDCVCGKWRLYERSVFPVFFEDDMRKSVLRFKYGGRLDKAEKFAFLVYRALLERGMLGGVDCVSFIPMAEKQRKKRGYNQAEELAKALSALTELPVEKLLYKCQDTPAQHDQSAVKRQGNLLGVYEPYPEKADFIDGKTVLLVDDVITTGATANEAAKTLLIFGAKAVFVAAAAGRRRLPDLKRQKA